VVIHCHLRNPRVPSPIDTLACHGTVRHPLQLVAEGGNMPQVGGGGWPDRTGLHRNYTVTTSDSNTKLPLLPPQNGTYCVMISSDDACAAIPAASG